jgi:protein-disulfide isomerase
MRSSLGIPIAIVIAAALIAGAIIYSGSLRGGAPNAANTDPAAQDATDIEVAPVTEKDHILGNPNAPIMIVEYSDFDCPFCKQFHETMHQVMENYGADGKVAWVYRHFPLTQLHPNAKTLAEASECVASIGGNDAFWKFADLVFRERGVNEQTDLTKLPDFAEQAGVSESAYTQCMDSGKFTAAIEDATAAAIKAGAEGTPHSILIAGDQQGPINGAQPYAVVKQMIDTLLAQMGS